MHSLVLLSCLVLSVAGNQNVDDDMQAADEAVAIADQISGEVAAPPADDDLQIADGLGLLQGQTDGNPAIITEPAVPTMRPVPKTPARPPAKRAVLANVAASKVEKLASKSAKHARKHSRKKHSHRHKKSKKQVPFSGAPDIVAVDAANAHIAAEAAKQAAKTASQVARHSVHLSENARDALQGAKDALHKARVDTTGLSTDQKELLSNAEAKLQQATKATKFGAVKDARYAKMAVSDQALNRLQDQLEMQKNLRKTELEQMRQELEQLRTQLETKSGRKAGDAGNPTEEEQALLDLEAMIQKLEQEESAGKKPSTSHDELKVEIEKLREAIGRLQHVELDYSIAKKPEKVMDELPDNALISIVGPSPVPAPLTPLYHHDTSAEVVAPAGRIDIDTAMPYGDLEPFGREDTAQELTEASIRESDQMVDQLERAEVAEEKRAVFRALTRLRGAAITSFDGVARSQTGNIDEYNKVHKWRNTHPLHHLADEESDVSKWAFPDNADF